MEDRKARLEARISQVPIEPCNVAGGEKTLVDDSAAGGRRNREAGIRLALDSLASQIEGTLELVALDVAGDDRLFDEWQHSPGMLAKH